MAITLKDVASVAGVSTATVSRALAGSERVAPQTASHIKMIADDLGYRFDNVARALRQKRSNLVGMVVPDYAFPYAQDLLLALNQELFQAEIVLACVSSFGSVEHELAQVKRLLGQRIDSLILMPVDPVGSMAVIEVSRAEELPIIQLFRPVPQAQTLDFLLDYDAALAFAIRSIGPGAIGRIAYVGDDQPSAGNDKGEALLRLMKQFPGNNSLKIAVSKPGATPRALRDAALQKLTCGPALDLIVVSRNENLPCVVEFVELHSSGQWRPLILCLEARDSAPLSASTPIVSLEFPMSGVAKGIVERIDAWMNGEAARRETVRIQPILNLSQL